MSRPSPLVLEALDMIKAKGLAPVVKNDGKHFKIGWIDHGRRFVLKPADADRSRRGGLPNPT